MTPDEIARSAAERIRDILPGLLVGTKRDLTAEFSAIIHQAAAELNAGVVAELAQAHRHIQGASAANSLLAEELGNLRSRLTLAEGMAEALGVTIRRLEHLGSEETGPCNATEKAREIFARWQIQEPSRERIDEMGHQPH